MLDFHAVSWLCGAVPALHLLAFLAAPETPVFLVKQGKVDMPQCGARGTLVSLQPVPEPAADTFAFNNP
ncbi:unnamed protein product [Plutella xylostella]|uniref:(diamondback moth) hypothetical protein n=1 Tax=Plutella xylostella TaxID=51655 RepID=A0A8S4FS94_PLUXY|nr:unnamed protein product [Plutella xylostella]